MRFFSTSCLAFGLATLVISPAAAEAQYPASKQEAARVAGEEALKLFSANRLPEAFEMFQRAEGEFHAVTLVLFMGHCQRMRGKLVDARALYQQVAGEALEPGAPNQFLTAQLLARAELERLRKRIPALVLRIKGAPEGDARVSLDGVPVPASSFASQDLDPGEHTLAATAPRAAPIQRTITLAEGATAEVELAFEARPEAPPPRAQARPSEPAGAPPQAPSTPPPEGAFLGLPMPALIAFGVGAAGLAVGAISGAAALAQAGDIKSDCLPTKHCPAVDQGRADAAGRLADASTIGFIAGGAAIVTGVVLVLVSPSGGTALRTEASRARVNIGPGFVALEGEF